jgi:TetR/AcrR family transcriptional regulator, cholesterol catabolism regulator
MTVQDKIHKAALTLFFRYGIRHVTMDEIARDLGMSKKTIYQYYREKDDLVTALCEIELQEHEKDFCALRDESHDAIHEIMLISQKIRGMMQHINPAFFVDLKKYHAAAFSRFEKFREGCIHQNILANLKSGIAAGLYRDDLDLEFVARYRLAQVDMLMFGDHFATEKFGLARSNELLLELFVYSISTVKGHQAITRYKKKTKQA